MARIPIFGNNDEVLTIPATDMRELISGSDPDGDGRILYLTREEYTNEHATEVGLIERADQNEAAITAANQRGAVQVPPADTVILEHAFGAMPFVTNLTVAVTNGTLANLSQLGSAWLS